MDKARKGDPVVVSSERSSTMMHGPTTKHEGYYLARVEKATREGRVTHVKTYRGDIPMSNDGRGLRFNRVFLLSGMSGDDVDRLAQGRGLEWDDMDELKAALTPLRK